jgi:hypothetical protein
MRDREMGKGRDRWRNRERDREEGRVIKGMMYE